jgi:hypothetical protein
MYNNARQKMARRRRGDKGKIPMTDREVGLETRVLISNNGNPIAPQ